MNYGKKSTARKEKELTSKGTMVRKKFSVIFCKTLLICFFLVAVVGICAGIGIFKGIIDSVKKDCSRECAQWNRTMI